jgi:hypothetical protein
MTTRVRCLTLSLILFCLMLGASSAQAAAQPSALETEKLRLEVNDLRARSSWWRQQWFAAALGLVTGAAGTAASFLAARRARIGSLDQSVHDKRLELYPQLVAALRCTALYFPNYAGSAARLKPGHCESTGSAMSKWYFSGGGLLLTVPARDSYFALVGALTHAASCKVLAVPTLPEDAHLIDVEKIDAYRVELGLASSRKGETIDVKKAKLWVFGSDRAAESRVSHDCWRFRDFIVLQALASDLRTKLARDLRSRNPPS